MLTVLSMAGDNELDAVPRSSPQFSERRQLFCERLAEAVRGFQDLTVAVLAAQEPRSVVPAVRGMCRKIKTSGCRFALDIRVDPALLR